MTSPTKFGIGDSTFKSHNSINDIIALAHTVNLNAEALEGLCAATIRIERKISELESKHRQAEAQLQAQISRSNAIIAELICGQTSLSRGCGEGCEHVGTGRLCEEASRMVRELTVKGMGTRW